MIASTGISLAAHSIRSCPSRARPAFFTSLVLASTLTCCTPCRSGSESDHAVDLPARQRLAALEVGQLDQELHPDHLAAQLLHQLDHGLRRASGRDHIVYHQDLLTGIDGVFVDVQDVL